MSSSSVPPPSFGPFRVLRPIAEGGMGSVFLCRQEDPVERDVAVKVVRTDLGDPISAARFELERQTLARMDHEGIARILDGGTTESGQAWFAMEYVPGLPLDDYCDQRDLSIPERIDLFRQVCDAVHHAHQKGVIHRDLKPDNILVRERDDRPHPKVIDFGLAKATAGRGALHTDPGLPVGTYEFMSPEQLGTDPLDLDTRTDIYALGVILYQLLAGSLPFPSERLRQAGMLEIQRILREEEPEPPSRRLSSSGAPQALAEQRGTDTRSLMRSITGDLDWIVMKALHKDRRHRYESAGALAADLGRNLRNEPVEAGPPSPWYRLRKWSRRHRAALAVGGVFLALVVGGTIALLTSQAERIEALHRADLLSQPAQLEWLKRQTVDEQYPIRAALVPELERWFEDVAELERLAPEVAGLAEQVRNGEIEVYGGAREALLAHAERTDDLIRGGLYDQVKDRLERARTIADRSVGVPGSAERKRWDDAIEAILVSDTYRDSIRSLSPQEGLVPLWENEQGYWEFFVVDTGSEPESPAALKDGIAGEHGVVLVLLPGDPEFRMGTSGRESDPRFSKNHESEDGEPVAAPLAPFFLARYETTQGQYERETGTNPADNCEGGEYPVEQAPFESAFRYARRLGLGLPTVAQWEYAYRAGSDAGWPEWVSPTLPGNLKQTGAPLGYERRPGDPPPEDDYPFTAPCGKFAPSPFGIFDLVGNVTELTCDEYINRFDDTAEVQGVESGTGRLLAAESGRVIAKGTSFQLGYRMSPAWRTSVPKRDQRRTVGFRLSRAIED